MSEPTKITDEALIRRVVEGDAIALECLYERYGRGLYSLALRIMGDPRDAEEVLQDTCVQLWRKSEQFDVARGSLIAWLLMITRHRAISRLRGQRIRLHGELLSNDATLLPQNLVSTHLDQQIVRELVSAAFAGLPEAQRTAISMAYFEGFTCEEIASRTQTPLGTTKTRLRSGLRTMKKVLSNPIVPGAPDWRAHS